MTLEEFFSAVDGDYSGVLSRLSKEERILKYVIKFADGSEYEQFQAALEEKNWEEAFRMIHSIKGMCLNLGLTKLAKSSSALCEMLLFCKLNDVQFFTLFDAKIA